MGLRRGGGGTAGGGAGGDKWRWTWGQVLERVLPEWRGGGHRVLLFSQTRQMLDILETFVARLGLTWRRMDGNTDIASRQAARGGGGGGA